MEEIKQTVGMLYLAEPQRSSSLHPCDAGVTGVFQDPRMMPLCWGPDSSSSRCRASITLSHSLQLTLPSLSKVSPKILFFICMCVCTRVHLWFLFMYVCICTYVHLWNFFCLFVCVYAHMRIYETLLVTGCWGLNCSPHD